MQRTFSHVSRAKALISFLSLWLICMCVSCAPSKMMTYISYQNISVGDNIFEVESLVGKPYEIKDRDDGSQEFVYIERIPNADTPGLFRKFILIVIDGKVMEKRTYEEAPSPIQLYSN